MHLPALHDADRSVMFRWGVLVIGVGAGLIPVAGDGVVAAAIRAPVPISVPEPLPRYVAARNIAVLRDPFVPRAHDFPAATLVEAVIIGDRPQALVLMGSRTIIVGIGDRIEGLRVASIGADGVRLSDGTVLGLAVKR